MASFLESLSSKISKIFSSHKNQNVQVKFHCIHFQNFVVDLNRNVDEELGESSFFTPSYTILPKAPFNDDTVRKRNPNLSSHDDSPLPQKGFGYDDDNSDAMRTMNELCSRWNEIHENNFALDFDNSHRMVEMSEDANYLVYRRGGTGANRLRRVASSESSNSDDSLVAGTTALN